MIKILFVCHGNICRSPMAQYVFQDIVDKHHETDNYFIDSCALSYEEEGNSIHWGTRDILDRHHIPYGNHRSRVLTKHDYETFDYLIIMDEYNLSLLKRKGYDLDKVYKLLKFCGLERDVKDPWWTENFDECYDDIVMGCNALYTYLEG